MVGEIRPLKVMGLKIGNSLECPGATLDPKGGSTKRCKSICMEGGVTHSGSTVVNFLLGVSGQIANPNDELS